MSLPGYTMNRYNASLAVTGLRTSDSGLYRCEVVVGINDEQDTVPLVVTGKYQLIILKELSDWENKEENVPFLRL